MQYKRFEIKKYKGVVDSILPVKSTPIPIIGVNESGKSSALEAVTQFDYRNDELSATKKWKFLNRYKPKEEIFEVIAVIEISQDAVDELTKELFPVETVTTVEPVPVSEAVAEPAAAVTPSPTPVEAAAETPPATAEPTEPAAAVTPTTTVQEIVPDRPSITVIDNALSISRIFESAGDTKKYYRIQGVEGYEEEVQKIVRALITKLPRIYYIGDFLERHLPDEIDFASYLTQSGNITEHQKIIAGAFTAAGISLKDCLEHSDPDTRSTWTKAVSKKMTDLIISDWNKMHVHGGFVDLGNVSDVRVELILSENKKKFTIKIYEKFTYEDHEFPEISTPLNERSLGFRWFFNFSAIKCFGAIEDESFIYLLDEPGSFLHNSAQSVLVEDIKELAKHHPVVYATHSEFLLDPEQININDIRIVQKENHEIKLVPYAETHEKKHEGALSTLYNALRRNIPLESVTKSKVIITEGVSDFYFWRPIIDVVFLPGLGAGNNKYLLSIAIGAASKYVALFDGDDAGNRAITQYKKYFNDEESKNWIQYVNSQGNQIKLEKLLSNSDTERLLKISAHPNPKTAFGALFYQHKAPEFWSGIDEETRNNVQKTLDNIVEKLAVTDKQLSFGFKKQNS